LQPFFAGNGFSPFNREPHARELIYEYLSTFDSTDHDVMQDTGCLPATCPPLPETCPPLPNMLAFVPGVPGVGRRVPAHKLNAVSGVGRRVPACSARRWQAGREAQARRAGVKAGLSWHGIYFAFTLSFGNLIFYQRSPFSPHGLSMSLSDANCRLLVWRQMNMKTSPVTKTFLIDLI